ncbi:MAG: DotU family type IV/VI secretion system protein [Planctomycetota bacterium]|nr:DotU family type IV/VI secretion system protein [Planctomycetota bacterium]
MSLQELCEPLFQYVCQLNRLSRKNGSADPAEVRARFKAILAEMKSKAEQKGDMGVQFERIELPLMFFIDFMMRESRFAFASTWKDLAHERREMAGYEKFFELLEETLADPTEAANQRLAVYYVCLGLGFTGVYLGQPDILKRKMVEIASRLRNQVQADLNSKVTPEAYEGVDRRKLTQAASPPLVGWAIALVVMTLAVLTGYVMMYFNTSRELRDSVGAINTTLREAATKARD